MKCVFHNKSSLFFSVCVFLCFAFRFISSISKKRNFSMRHFSCSLQKCHPDVKERTFGLPSMHNSIEATFHRFDTGSKNFALSSISAFTCATIHVHLFVVVAFSYFVSISSLSSLLLFSFLFSVCKHMQKRRWWRL